MPNIKEKWEELKLHSALILVPENFRDDAIQKIYGYITKAAIDNSKKWQININDFQRDMRHALSKFTTDNVPFHFVPKTDVKTDQEYKEFEFIKKMQNIKLKKQSQELAFSDYLRTQETQIHMLMRSPTLEENLNIYKENITRDLIDEKTSHSYTLNQNSINTDIADKKSREVYTCCLSKHHNDITGVNDTQKYYRDGQIHHIVDEGDFEWKYNEEEV